MDKISIAVISDLHCVHSSKDEGGVTLLHTDAPIFPHGQHPVQALKTLIRKEALKCDYVVCAGDITNKACSQGIISGYQFVESIKNELQAKRSFYTPGNHDVNSYSTNDPVPTEYLKNRLDDFPICPRAEDVSLVDCFWSKGYCFYIENGIVVLIINSTHTHTTSDRAGKSLITDLTLQSITESICELPTGCKLKIAISHHHPKIISNSNNIESPDHSVMENGDKLIALLSANKFNIYIHGHKHMPQLNVVDSLPILSAGSFSSLENLRAGADTNRFHIIDLDCDTGECKGRIRSWSYRYGNGWSFDKNEFMLPAFTGFGAKSSVCDLVTKINKYIEDNNGNCKFARLVSEFPDISYLLPMQQFELQKELLENYLIEFQPSLGCGTSYVFKKLDN